MIPFRPLLVGLGLVLAFAVGRGQPTGLLPPGPFDDTNVFGEQREAPQGFLPPVRPTDDIPMRDPSIMLGPDGFYYMVGTQPPDGSKNFWDPYNGIRLFRSSDLQSWENLGYVYTLKDNGTWQPTYQPGKLLPSFVPDQAHPKPTIWAPDLYYMKGTWWIAYALAYNGWGTCNGMLKSTSGKPTGPYVEVNTNGPIVDQIDPGLLQDNDGTVYYVWNNGKFAAMNDAMNQLAEKPQTAEPSNDEQVAFEGAALRQINGRYYMMAAGDGGTPRSYHEFSTYDTWVASTDRVKGKYGPHYIGVRNGGHNVFFRDKEGNWWTTFFGWNPNNPFNEKPAALRIQLDEYAHVQPYENHFTILSPDARVAGVNWSYTSATPDASWAQPGFDDSRWPAAQGAFGANAVTDQPVPVRTLWTAPEIWMRRHFTLPRTNDPVPQISLDIFHQGPTEVYINGVSVYTSSENEHYYRESNPLSPEAVKALVVGGDNVIAIHSACGPQRIVDAGLRLFYHTEPMPVSTGKMATASSSADPAHGAAQAVDGSLDSAWMPAATDQNPSLVVDLGQVEEITRTDLYFDAPHTWHHYKIDYSSDQTNWSTFYDSTQRLAVGDPCYTDVFDNGISADHVTGRYVRLTLADAQDAARPAVKEFRVFGHPPETNLDLALGKPVTASGSEDRYPAPNAVDGYWGTKWRARGDGARQLTVDLGAVQTIHCCKTWFSDPGLTYRYQIETSPDNQAWTMFADRSGNTEPNDPCYADYAPASARYVRLTELGVDVNIPIDVRNFRVYGESTPLPPAVLPLAATMLGHWKLDETSGTTAGDASPAGHDGTLQGSATWLPAGQIGGALELQGGSLSVPCAPTGPFTVAFWLRTSDKGPAGGWKDGEPLVSSSGGAWGVSLVADTLALGLGDRTLLGSQAVNDGNWHECAVTRDASGVGRIVIDGICQVTADGPASLPASEGGGLVFGGGSFHGDLDDIYLFTRPLSDLELGVITALPPKLAGKWTFDEGAGEVAADSSGLGNAAHFHGSPSWTATGVGGHSITFADDSTYGEIRRPVKDDFTIAMWIKTTQTSPDHSWNEGAWLVNGEMPGDTNDFGTSLSGGHFVFGTGAPDTTLASRATVNNGTWHFCVATRARLTGTLKVYVDGKLDGTQLAGRASLTAPSVLRLGSTGDNRFNGSLSDVEIYSGVLEEKDIAALYQSGRALLRDKSPVADQHAGSP